MSLKLAQLLVNLQQVKFRVLLETIPEVEHIQYHHGVIAFQHTLSVAQVFVDSVYLPCFQRLQAILT